KADVFHNPRTKKVYRRLRPGDLVKQDQVIAVLDDEQAYLEFQGADTKAKTAAESAKAYEETVKKLKQIVEQERIGARSGSVPLQELYNSEATLARYQSEHVDHLGQAEVAAKDAEKAKYIWDRHFLKPAVDGEVQQILKHEGEGVKAGQEPLLTIHDFGQLRVVGNLPKEYVTAVARGDEAKIEVAR